MYSYNNIPLYEFAFIYTYINTYTDIHAHTSYIVNDIYTHI